MHSYVHYSIIHDREDMETTYMSINEWMNKEVVVCIHTMEIPWFSHQKEGNPAIYSNLEGTWRHCPKWNMPDKDRYYILLMFSWTVNFQKFKLDLEKAEEPEIKLPTSAGSWKKQESSRKTSISDLLTMPQVLTACITIICRKFWKRWKYQTT